MRQFFKTTKLHHCFAQDKGERLPDKCRCRRFISIEFARQLVADGIADWLVDFLTATQTKDIVLSGKVGKTPRAKTVEKADIERYVDAIWRQKNGMESFEGDDEVLALYDRYHDSDIEVRCELFKGIGMELLAHKQFSDTHGNIAGIAARVLADKLIDQADAMKLSVAVDDPYVGLALFMPLGGDQRTCVGVDVEKSEIKLDTRYESW